MLDINSETNQPVKKVPKEKMNGLEQHQLIQILIILIVL